MPECPGKYQGDPYSFTSAGWSLAAGQRRAFCPFHTLFMYRQLIEGGNE